jgi:hypothetical protein
MQSSIKGALKRGDPGATGATGPSVATVSGTIDFGWSTGGEGEMASVTLSASGVTVTSQIICQINAVRTADHDPDDVAIEGLMAYPANIVAGVGFDCVVCAPAGTWGRYGIVAFIY